MAFICESFSIQKVRTRGPLTLKYNIPVLNVDEFKIKIGNIDNHLFVFECLNNHLDWIFSKDHNNDLHI